MGTDHGEEEQDGQRLDALGESLDQDLGMG